MFVGIMKIELRFPPVASIKDKRKIVNRVKMKLAARYKISIAEVDDQDYYNSAVLGLSFVSLKRDHAVSRMQKIEEFLETNESHVFEDAISIVEEY
ncbi:MAG: DUF503 domain-containing protein [Spirochaetes bacterium]|nr:DUF503 domain-containing protein [Spirochaetota bacterium]